VQATGLLDERTEPICQKEGNYTGSHSKNEQCGNETVPVVPPAAPISRVIEVALNEVVGWSSSFLDRVVTLFLRAPTHKCRPLPAN
jgi:hypothetical protein